MEGHSPVVLLIVVAPLVAHGPQGTRASVVAAPRYENTGSVVVAHGHSCLKAWETFLALGICVPCIGRQILNHWTTREGLL